MAQMRRERARSGSRSLARRLGLTGKKAVVAACCAVLAAAAAAGIIWQLATPGVLVTRASGNVAAETEGGAGDSAAPSGSSEASDAKPEESTEAIVHVDGAVAAPGVYRLEGDDLRVQDAVEAAGGLTLDADTSTVNLASTLEDGAKVHIPATGEVAQAAPSGTVGASSANGSASTGIVNINTASAEELQSLPGVGPATAQAIIEDREQNGPFASPEDLMRVSGIGEKKYAKLEGHICV